MEAKPPVAAEFAAEEQHLGWSGYAQVKPRTVSGQNDYACIIAWKGFESMSVLFEVNAGQRLFRQQTPMLRC